MYCGIETVSKVVHPDGSDAGLWLVQAPGVDPQVFTSPMNAIRFADSVDLMRSVEGVKVDAGE